LSNKIIQRIEYLLNQPELYENTCLFKLTDTERDRLGNALSRIAYDPNGSLAYITDLRITAISTLPRRIIDALSEQRASIQQPSSHLIFENLPTDEQVFTTPDPDIFTPGSKERAYQRKPDHGFCIADRRTLFDSVRRRGYRE
jgi:hypothetical protein